MCSCAGVYVCALCTVHCAPIALSACKISHDVLFQLPDYSYLYIIEDTPPTLPPPFA